MYANVKSRLIPCLEKVLQIKLLMMPFMARPQLEYLPTSGLPHLKTGLMEKEQEREIQMLPGLGQGKAPALEALQTRKKVHNRDIGQNPE